jgi:hypothetical protein
VANGAEGRREDAPAPVVGGDVVAGPARREEPALGHASGEPARRADDEVERLLAGSVVRADERLNQQSGALGIVGPTVLQVVQVRAVEPA